MIEIIFPAWVAVLVIGLLWGFCCFLGYRRLLYEGTEYLTFAMTVLSAIGVGLTNYFWGIWAILPSICLLWSIYLFAREMGWVDKPGGWVVIQQDLDHPER